MFAFHAKTRQVGTAPCSIHEWVRLSNGHKNLCFKRPELELPVFSAPIGNYQGRQRLAFVTLLASVPSVYRVFLAVGEWEET